MMEAGGLNNYDHTFTVSYAHMEKELSSQKVKN